MLSRNFLIAGSGRATTTARTLSSDAASLCYLWPLQPPRPAFACCLDLSDLPGPTTRSKFRFICLARISVQETKHRGAGNEVLLGPF
jgi:hypothetical protein